MPLAGGGTPVRDWLCAPGLPELDPSGCPALVIVAPHPDDETLGLGGTAAQLADRGVPVQVVSVSDGGGAVPGLSDAGRLRLEHTRRSELDAATTVLGVAPPVRLGFPDGRLAEFESAIAERVAAQLDRAGPGVWCAATWRGDGHPDHEAVGRAAAVAAGRCAAVFVEYPVWMWHWARPGDAAVPWERAFQVPLDERARIRKQRAAQCFPSQFGPGRDGSAPTIPSAVVDRLLAVGEVLFR
ncbi:PIG-L deacetylase family protein [Mycolicibacterium palauense]|uniref:PIG-L deacetylase family protein n=1 Tax=Mycolicibacterium palauense TaxID=2034511 RepID=UPI000BFEB337|nr:PIG-L family deacetylase [Mycolicibacterium palauense]